MTAGEPKKDSSSPSSCCGGGRPCGCGESCRCKDNFEKTALIEYLYLDLETCDRCAKADKVLDEVVEVLTPALKLDGYTVRYRKTEMATEEIARYHRFLSSPTIRVNGLDICGPVIENPCGCCGEISGTDVSCRVFEYGGKTYEVPPKEMLAEGILKALFGKDGGRTDEPYEMPENLRVFYAGKRRKNIDWCKGSCC